MPNKKELLLQLLGADEKERLAPLLMQDVLNHGIDLLPDVIQTGKKRGQTLRAHIQNVVCFSYQLAELLNIEDREKTHLIAAAYLHDLNKFPEHSGKSYDSIANETNIQTILDMLLKKSDYDYDLSTNLIVSVIRGHSSKLHVDGDGLFASDKEDRDKKELTGILQAADILDLSHHFHERDKKEQALRILNGLIDDFQYEYTWHHFGDDRGIFTNLVQNTVVRLYQKQGVFPLLFYPDGVWYLVRKGESIKVLPDDVANLLQQQINDMSIQDRSKLLSYKKGVAFNFGLNPFHLGLEPAHVMNLIAEAISGLSDQSHQRKYEKLEAKSGSKCFQEYINWLKKADERGRGFRKASDNLKKALKQLKVKSDFENDENFGKLTEGQKKKLRSAYQKFLKAKDDADLEKRFKETPLWESKPDRLFYPDIEIMQCGILVGSFAYLLSNYCGFESEMAWNHAAEAAGLKLDEVPELQFFNKQSDRSYRTAVILHDKGIGFETVSKNYTDFLSMLNIDAQKTVPDKEIIDYIRMNFRTKDSPFAVDRSLIKEYMASNHRQCCHCGNAIGIELMIDDLPKGIKKQLFSNRLGAGGGEPARNVCRICQYSFRVEKLIHEIYDNHYYLHLFADGGEYSSHAEPGIFVDALKNGILNLQHEDCRSFLIQPGQIINKYIENREVRLYGVPKKKWGMVVPRFSQNVGGQISIGINTPGGKKSNDGTRFLFALFYLLFFTSRFHLRGVLSKSAMPPLKADEFQKLFIDHIAMPFRAMIPENNLNAKQTEKLREDLVAVYGLRNTYGITEEKEICDIAKILYDKNGLELIYFLRKKYSATARTREFAPWKKAWPFLKPFIREEQLMPIKHLAEIALNNHFHGKTWKETSQAKPIDLAFDALAKHREPESEADLKMIILHDVTRGLERLSSTGSLGKERYAAVKTFVDLFFERIYKERYKADKNRIIKDQRRIRSAFLGYLAVLRDETI